MSKQNSLVIHRSGEKYTSSTFYPNSFKTRSSRMRNVNAKTSNLSLGSTTTVSINSELTSKAARNGDGPGWTPPTWSQALRCPSSRCAQHHSEALRAFLRSRHKNCRLRK